MVFFSAQDCAAVFVCINGTPVETALAFLPELGERNTVIDLFRQVLTLSWG